MARSRASATRSARLPNSFPKRPGRNRTTSRLVRLLDLLRLISSDSGWTAPKLARHFRVTTRRVYHDLEILGGIGVRYVLDQSGYRILSSALLLPVTLNIPEVLALLSPGRAEAEHRKTAQIKLSSALPAPLREVFRDPRRISTSFQITPVDPSVWSVLGGCMAASHQIQFRYKGNNDETEKDRIADPYAIFLKRSGWYLVAWAPERLAYRLFRLDRIEELRSMNRLFTSREDFRLAEFLENPLGVGIGQLLHAKVEVLPSHVASVRSEAAALGLQFQSNGRGGLLQIQTGVLDQVAWWLAQFGEGIRVLSPPALRARLIGIAQRILALNRK